MRRSSSWLLPCAGKFSSITENVDNDNKSLLQQPLTLTVDYYSLDVYDRQVFCVQKYILGKEANLDLDRDLFEYVPHPL